MKLNRIRKTRIRWQPYSFGWLRSWNSWSRFIQVFTAQFSWPLKPSLLNLHSTALYLLLIHSRNRQSRFFFNLIVKKSPISMIPPLKWWRKISIHCFSRVRVLLVWIEYYIFFPLDAKFFFFFQFTLTGVYDTTTAINE